MFLPCLILSSSSSIYHTYLFSVGIFIFTIICQMLMSFYSRFRFINNASSEQYPMDASCKRYFLINSLLLINSSVNNCRVSIFFLLVARKAEINLAVCSFGDRKTCCGPDGLFFGVRNVVFPIFSFRTIYFQSLLPPSSRPRTGLGSCVRTYKFSGNCPGIS